MPAGPMDVSGAVSSDTDSDTAPAAPALELAGRLPRPGWLDLAALKRLPPRDLGPTQVLCFTGRAVAQAESYVGARLIDVLDACGFSEQPRSEMKRCVVIGWGQDGYQAIFSWSELFNSAIGDKALVLYEKNGQPLDAHLGRLCLISASDSRLGPRHLRALHRISVQKL